MNLRFKDENKGAKLLVVERKLISNRGHHHTQVAALQSLLPNHSAYFAAGEGYDGFLGPAAGILPAHGLKAARVGQKLKFGSLSQRIAARLNLLLSGRFSAPLSAYGKALAKICERNDFGPQDVVVVPTAELDSLESARELTYLLGGKAPQICLRFLGLELGEKNAAIREKRLVLGARDLPPNISLFSETEELANYLNSRYSLRVRGGFFMPCSVPIALSPRPKATTENHLKVGVFGAPRKEKGSARIAAIVAALSGRNLHTSGSRVEFIVQGSSGDFSSEGVYGDLPGLNDNVGVGVTRLGDRLSPADFRQQFESVDIILLPYDQSVYALQGSGVIQDAIGAFKPIIHSNGMSMLSLLNHGNALAATTDEEFATAITQMATRLDSFKAGAAAAAAYYSDQLSASPLRAVLSSPPLRSAAQ